MRTRDEATDARPAGARARGGGTGIRSRRTGGVVGDYMRTLT
jgi:hypothetical protein